MPSIHFLNSLTVGWSSLRKLKCLIKISCKERKANLFVKHLINNIEFRFCSNQIVHWTPSFLEFICDLPSQLPLYYWILCCGTCALRVLFQQHQRCAAFPSRRTRSFSKSYPKIEWNITFRGSPVEILLFT
jgi:hypothetical protein